MIFLSISWELSVQFQSCSLFWWHLVEFWRHRIPRLPLLQVFSVSIRFLIDNFEFHAVIDRMWLCFLLTYTHLSGDSGEGTVFWLISGGDNTKHSLLFPLIALQESFCWFELRNQTSRWQVWALELGSGFGLLVF